MKRFVMVISICFALAGCGGPAPEKKGFRPVDEKAAVFWDRQTTDTAGLLGELVDEYNASHKGLPIRVEHTGGYADIFRKVSASIEAGVLPAMAVSYENMTTEYVPTGAVTALEDRLADPEEGLTKEEQADIFPVVFDTCRYRDFGDKIYSFPFAKSVLVLYFNRQVLREAGLEQPPATWDEFLAQCRQIKARTGKQAMAISVDCSTVDAMIFSRGGEVLEGNRTLFDAPAAIEVFEMYETLAREQLAYPITPSTFEDNNSLAKNDIAFTFRTSSSRSALMTLMNGDHDRWGIAVIPQKDPAHPATVLYGPSITIFKTTPEQQQAAWSFVRWFTSPAVSARWAAGTGYLPVRQAALKEPVIQESFKEWPYNRVAYDCLAFARAEPNIAGWQQVRDLVVRALSEVLSGAQSGRAAAQQLKKEADAALARHAAG